MTSNMCSEFFAHKFFQIAYALTIFLNIMKPSFGTLINRPGVAGAVLQTPLSLIQ